MKSHIVDLRLKFVYLLQARMYIDRYDIYVVIFSS